MTPSPSSDSSTSSNGGDKGKVRNIYILFSSHCFRGNKKKDYNSVLYIFIGQRLNDEYL